MTWLRISNSCFRNFSAKLSVHQLATAAKTMHRASIYRIISSLLIAFISFEKNKSCFIHIHGQLNVKMLYLVVSHVERFPVELSIRYAVMQWYIDTWMTDVDARKKAKLFIVFDWLRSCFEFKGKWKFTQAIDRPNWILSASSALEIIIMKLPISHHIRFSVHVWSSYDALFGMLLTTFFSIV